MIFLGVGSLVRVSCDLLLALEQRSSSFFLFCGSTTGRRDLSLIFFATNRAIQEH
jgi:hypothetical protein